VEGTPDEARFRREQHDFDTLFRAHHAEIVRYLAARLGSREEARDVAADVFVEAWRRVPGLQWRGRPVRAWLYRVAANLAADEVKRRARRPLPTPPPVEQAQTDTADDRLALAAALRTLPADHQLVVHLRLVEGLSFAEVSRVMNRSVGACQMLMLRAARSLRDALADEGVRDV